MEVEIATANNHAHVASARATGNHMRVCETLFSMSAGGENLHRQGSHRRDGDYRIPQAWHTRRPIASAASDSYTQVPGQSGYESLVSHVHVGHYLSQVLVFFCANSNSKAHLHRRNTDPPIWYDTDVKLFEIQRVQ